MASLLCRFFRQGGDPRSGHLPGTLGHRPSPWLKRAGHYRELVFFSLFLNVFAAPRGEQVNGQRESRKYHSSQTIGHALALVVSAEVIEER